MRTAETIIKRPVLTEKGTFLKETGGGAVPEGAAEGESGEAEGLKPQFVFEVARDANKVEIRRAVEALWNVEVVKVRTAIVRGKDRRVGKFTGRRSNWKKALVTLAPGQTIEFFEGV